MITISLCMIVKNEQDVLGRCLESVKDVVDEIIIADTGSTDKTQKIARLYTDNVYSFKWVDDFSAARNFAFSKASMDYQMWLDADDILPAEEAQKLLKLKSSLPKNVDVVTMKYHTHFDAHGNPVFTSTRGRLFRTSIGFSWQDTVHEYVPMAGRIEHSGITIWHKKISAGSSDRNLKIYKRMLHEGKPFTPRNIYYYARELMDHMEYEQAAEQFSRFLDGKGGWVEDEITACLAMGRCYASLKQDDKALDAFIRSFSYAPPRPEICCELGYLHMRKNDYKNAAGWFELAISAPPVESIGFVQPEYSGFIPHIELCVCYSKLGDFKKAYKHNEKAGELNPHSKAVQQNGDFLTRAMSGQSS